MNSFLNNNKSLFTYALIFLIIVPFFGFNFLISLVGNILILLLLLPLLMVIIAFLGFNSLKSKVKTCSNCGTISLGLNDICMNCGANLDDINNEKNQLMDNPSEKTIEVKAEEIK